MLTSVPNPVPQFAPERERFISFDGAELGLTMTKAEGTDTPEYVVVGVHGMNDYANAFQFAAPYWAERGVTTYAYDQRGFGRSLNPGIWPREELMREDLRTAVDVARQRHPDAVITVVGISMGGAVAMTAFGSDDPPKADRLILSGPGLRGWGAIRLPYRPSLWFAARFRPGWVVVPPKGVKIEPTDNIEVWREMYKDPLMQRNNRIDQLHGVVSLMENAHDCVEDLPENTFLSYGAKDIVIPPRSAKRTHKRLPGHVRTGYYENGYHMLLRDLNRELLFEDYLTFMRDPSAELPSGMPEIPWRG